MFELFSIQRRVYVVFGSQPTETRLLVVSCVAANVCMITVYDGFKPFKLTTVHRFGPHCSLQRIGKEEKYDSTTATIQSSSRTHVSSWCLEKLELSATSFDQHINIMESKRLELLAPVLTNIWVSWSTKRLALFATLTPLEDLPDGLRSRVLARNRVA